MKHGVKGMVMPVNKEDLQNLLKETIETVATEVVNKDEKQFGAIDLWNIQKQYRPKVLRKWLN